MKQFHLSIRRAAAVLIGIVLVASGLMKLHDPVGTGLIVTEYFKLCHIGISLGFAKGLGVALSLFELAVGAALVTGVFKKTVAVLTWILLGFFTLVTLLLLIFNPEMDCGCFGEAIHLTHLQSFLKNIILLALAAVAFIPRSGDADASLKGKIAFWCILASFFVAAIYNLGHNPSADLTAFAPGNELFASLDNDYEAADSVIVVPAYRRDAQRAVLSDGFIPDSTWSFVGLDTLKRNSMRFPGKTPSLSFSDRSGEYQDEMAVLGKVGVISVYDPSKMTPAKWRAISVLSEDLFAEGASPIILSTSLEAVPDYLSDYAYTADYKTLITLNRSNGGLTYIDNGMIVRKWEHQRLPVAGDLSRVLSADSTEEAISAVSRGRIRVQGFVLYLAAAFIFL